MSSAPTAKPALQAPHPIDMGGSSEPQPHSPHAVCNPSRASTAVGTTPSVRVGDEPPTTPTDGGSGRRSYHPRDKGICCALFLSGSCDLAVCPFAHVDPSERRPVPSAVCSFYKESHCLRDNCRFYHGGDESLAALQSAGGATYAPIEVMQVKNPLGPLDLTAEVAASAMGSSAPRPSAPGPLIPAAELDAVPLKIVGLNATSSAEIKKRQQEQSNSGRGRHRPGPAELSAARRLSDSDTTVELTPQAFQQTATAPSPPMSVSLSSLPSPVGPPYAPPLPPGAMPGHHAPQPPYAPQPAPVSFPVGVYGRVMAVPPPPPPPALGSVPHPMPGIPGAPMAYHYVPAPSVAAAPLATAPPGYCYVPPPPPLPSQGPPGMMFMMPQPSGTPPK